jgi:ribosomal protein S27AE
MSINRFKDGREHRFTISKPTEIDPVLIACPKCLSKAVVVPVGEEKVRASCSECGYTTEKSSNGRSFYWHGENPTDGYFGFNLWLRTDCIGNSLWAFNKEHLTFLESYVSAKLRERTKDEELGWRNSSLASRLPKWIKSSKNRDALLKAINKLKSKA